MKKRKIEISINDDVKKILDNEDGINDADKIVKIILKYEQLKSYYDSIEIATRNINRKFRDVSRKAFSDPESNRRNKNYLLNKLDTILHEHNNSTQDISIIVFDAAEAFNKLNSDNRQFITKNVSTNLTMQSREIDIVGALDSYQFALITLTANEKSLIGYAERCKRIISTAIMDFLEEKSDLDSSIFYGFTTAEFNDTPELLVERAVNEAYKAKLKSEI